MSSELRSQWYRACLRACYAAFLSSSEENGGFGYSSVPRSVRPCRTASVESCFPIDSHGVFWGKNDKLKEVHKGGLLLLNTEGYTLKSCDDNTKCQITMAKSRRPSPWEGVVSGTAAAIAANVLVYPLDMYFPQRSHFNLKSIKQVV